MFHKSLRVIAAAAVLALTGIGLSSAAYADVNSSVIDPAAEKSLIVHKYEGPAVNCPRDGSDQTKCVADAKAAPLKGAEFTIWKVRDLRTNADWEAAKEQYNAGAESYSPTGTGTMLVTDADGVANFTGLDAALYFVKETKAPTGSNGATYTAAAPFFVTVPMTTPDKTAWDYSVDVYPKNTKFEKPHKAVIDKTTIKVGDPVDYRVSSVIPNYGDVVGPPGADGKYTGPDKVVDSWDVGSYSIWDKFDANLTDITVKSVVIVPATADATTYTDAPTATLAADTDYTVLRAGNTVQIELTKAGLDKLAANGGAQLVADFGTKIAKIPDNGLVPNQAYVVPGSTPGQGGTPPTPPTTPPTTPPGTPTNTVVSKFGQIAIKKVGVNGTGDTDRTPLPGVEFSVFQAKVAGAAPNFTYSCARNDLADQSAISTFTTNDKGEGISGFLRLSNWYNDGVVKDASGNNDGYLDGKQYAEKFGWRTYCLVETKAAPNYQLLAEPVTFNLTTEGTVTTVSADAPVIVNQADNVGNKLPLTGGQGIALAGVGGVALIGAGLGYYMWTSRRRQNA